MNKHYSFLEHLSAQYTNPHFILLKPGRKDPLGAWRDTYPSLDEVKRHINSGGNIGFTANDFFCLDIDDRSQCGPWLMEFETDFLGTLVVKTPRAEGYHVYFKLAPDQIVNSTPCKIDGLHLDTRGVNHSYVVIPPSVVRDETTNSRVAYELCTVGEHATNQPKPLPAGLYKRLSPHVNKGVETYGVRGVNAAKPLVDGDPLQSRYVEQLAREFETVQPGHRNQRLINLVSSASNVLPESMKKHCFNVMIAAAYKNGYMDETTKEAFDKQFESAWNTGKKPENGYGNYQLWLDANGVVTKGRENTAGVIRDYDRDGRHIAPMDWTAITAQFKRLAVARTNGTIFFKGDVARRFSDKDHKAFQVACEMRFKATFDLHFKSVEEVLLNLKMDETIEDYDLIDSLPIFNHEDSLRIFSTFIAAPYDHSYLDEFVGLFDNVETAQDRLLLKAAVCTPMFCGGGKNPLFVVMADMQGSGKTELVKAIGDLYSKNGCMKFLADKLDGTRIISDLLTNEAKTRVILVDNLKKVADSSSLEDFITSRTIQGHKMYVGHALNYNMYTWFITANMPKLSRDMAERAYIIKLKKPKTYSVSWQDKLADLLKNHGGQILSEIADILSGAPKFTYMGGTERWPVWIRRVLSLICTEDEFKTLIDLQQERRSESDTQKNTASLINEAVASWKGTHDYERGLTYAEMCAILNDAGITDSIKARALANFLQPMISSGELKIRLVRHSDGRRVILD